MYSFVRTLGWSSIANYTYGLVELWYRLLTIRIHIHTYVYVYIYIYIYIYIHICVYIYIHTYVYIHVCIYTRMYIYTYSVFEVHDSMLSKWLFIAINFVAICLNFSLVMATEFRAICPSQLHLSDRLHGSPLQGKNLRACDTNQEREREREGKGKVLGIPSNLRILGPSWLCWESIVMRRGVQQHRFQMIGQLHVPRSKLQLGC